MLTADGCQGRRERLWESLPGPCDVLVIGDPQHLIYFANYVPSPFTFRTNDAGALLVMAPDRVVLVGDNLLKPFLDEAHVDEVRAPVWYEGKRSAADRRELLVRSTLEALATFPGKRIGIEPSAVPAGVVEGLRQARPGVEWVDLAPIVRELRRTKGPDEIEVIRRSIRAGEAGFAAALAGIGPGMTEFQAYQLIEQACLAEAGARAIVYGDFVSGPRSKGSLGPPTHRQLVKGDLYILDFSVVIDGYRGDFANTLVIGGDPTSFQRERHEGCLAAVAAGEALLRPGTPGRDVDAAVRRAFAGRGLDGDFPSHSGHGIGLSHPEPPYFVPESDDLIRAGDVVTLEPGQYGDDFGGMRFEHNYLITPDGSERLTHHRLTLAP